jgi:CRP-like cAMP-binding protein
MNNIHNINSKSDRNNLSQRIMEALKPFLYVKTVKKQETLLMEGDVCKNIYFVQSGAVKQYYLSDGKEFIQNFFFEGNMASAFDSFFTQTTAESYLEAIEGTELMVLSFHNFQAICSAKPEFSTQLNICMSRMNSNRVNLLLMSDGMMRYKKFLENEPQVSQRVPQYMVASYLGMTPETLSRIRKRMSIKKAA